MFIQRGFDGLLFLSCFCRDKGMFPSMQLFDVFYDIAPKGDCYSFRNRLEVKAHVGCIPSSFKGWKRSFFYIHEDMVSLAMTDTRHEEKSYEKDPDFFSCK